MYTMITAKASINPKLCNHSKVLIQIKQAGEGPIPHVHVSWSNHGKNMSSCICLTCAKYCTYHKKQEPKLPDDVKDTFINVMSKPWKYKFKIYDKKGNEIILTGYQRAVEIWCDTYGENHISKFHLDANGLPIMPDYSKL